MKEKITLNEEQLREIIESCVRESLNEAIQDEDIFSRLGAADDAFKDWSIGNGKFSDISKEYKKQKAIDLFTKYRNLLTKANQMKNPAINKAKDVFGATDGYAQAKEFAKGGYQAPAPVPQPVNESVDENFGGGLRAGFNQAKSNVQNGGIRNMFNGLRGAYSRGDAAGDANNYVKAMTAANTAKKTFLDYCTKNNIDPHYIVSLYDTSERSAVLHGDRDRIKARHAVQNSQINGKRGTGNSKKAPSAAAPNFMQTSRNRTIKRNNTLGPVLRNSWFESINKEALNNIIKEELNKYI